MIVGMVKDGEDENSGDEDGALWAFITKDVRRLDSAKTGTQPLRKKRIRLNPSDRPVALPSVTVPSGGGIDRNTETRMRKGEIRIEARLDLHGRTVDAARGDLEYFVRGSFIRGYRCILVITGKGREAGDPAYAPGKGAIRREFKYWLGHEQLKPFILSVAQARAQHGGSGAFYIYLRKNKTA